MAALNNSTLLDDIFKYAEKLKEQNQCGGNGIPRDYIFIAAIHVIDRRPETDSSEELLKTRELLNDFSRDPELMKGILGMWSGKEVSMNERMIVSMTKNHAIEYARYRELSEITAEVYIEALLKSKTDSIQKLFLQKLRSGASAESEQKPTAKSSEDKDEKPAASKETREEKEQSPADQDEGSAASKETEEQKNGVSGIIESAKNLQSKLLKSVFGQDHAVSIFTEGYFQAELRSSIEKDRVKPRATFLLAGAPGVGKTHLAKESARILGLPFLPLDMSEYNVPEAVDKLCGYNANFKSPAEGTLTGFVHKNPKCLLLFDEIEKCSLEVIHLFLQILDAGRLSDAKLKKEVSFTETIIIFTTNAGRSLYESDTAQNLSILPRDVILDALAKETNPLTHQPFFPAAICSRFASGNVVMLNHLDAHTLRRIVEKQFRDNAEDMSRELGVRVEFDEQTATAVLLAVGAAADARKVKARAESLFSSELYELYRLISSNKIGINSDTVKKIRFTVDTDYAPEEIRKLFFPSERIHALVYGSAMPEIASDSLQVPIFHRVSTLEEAHKVMETESIQLVFCDLFSQTSGNEQLFLNHEDIPSPSRDFMHDMLTNHPQIPVVVIETPENSFSVEEKTSYLRRGVQDFITIGEEGWEDRIGQFTGQIFQQNNMTELARTNKLITFESAQTVSDDRTAADIILFDMKLEKAIKAEDASNILSMLSVPDVNYDDIIGADSAKDELKFFMKYMHNTSLLRKQGVGAPHGILLYGPPGTGKTMLAKAFAAESHATFIAVQGNQFIRRYIGEGHEMVHRLFSTARKYAPSVLFIDEIDVIAKKRTGRDTDMANDIEQILTALLAEMDGFSTDMSRPVFVMGATNYSVDSSSAMTLDPAVMRRFDRRILIDLPNKENRMLFLKREIEKKPIFDVSEQCIQSIADRSVGMSLANLTSFMDMAARLSIQENKESVSDQDFETYFEKFNSGDEKKWSEEIMLRTARHESGHTLISWLSGEKPSYVTIVSRGNYGGYMQHGDQEGRLGYTRKELLSRICTSLGGRAAEIVYYGSEEGLTTGASGDLQNATNLALNLLCSFGMDDGFGLAAFDLRDESLKYKFRDDINKMLKEQLDIAVQMLSENRSVLDKLVEKLLENSNLHEKDIDEICSGVVE